MNWTTEAECIARQVAPDLDDVPIYFIDADQIRDYEPRLCSSNAIAWTCPVCDLMCSDWLRGEGRWNGRGFCAIVKTDQLTDPQSLIGACLHELAHGIDHGLPGKEAVPSDKLFADLPFVLNLQDVVRAEDAAKPTPPTYAFHESRFIRAASHLGYRAGLLLESVRPKHLQFATPYHGQPFTEQAFMDALGDELAARVDEPISNIIDSPEPQRFSQRWEGATRNQQHR